MAALSCALYMPFAKEAIRSCKQLPPNPPESALLRGILLGDESGISSELAQDYSRTGTSHIIAISGFNMVVLAGG